MNHTAHDQQAKPAHDGGGFAPHARPGERFLELEKHSHEPLERVFESGFTPDLDALIGWEFRGVNVPAWAYVAGVKKFVKGFYRPGGGAQVYGYNCPVVQDGLGRPWRTRPSDDAPRRFGFYRVLPVDATSRDNAHLHAVLLDYDQGGNHRMDPSRGLRDYLVRVDRDNPDLYLGKAYYALGPGRLAVSYFLLERHRRRASGDSGTGAGSQSVSLAKAHASVSL
jgi:hypothetical protein